MAQRTISEAEERLETTLLAPTQRKEYEKHLRKVKNRAVAEVHQRIERKYQALNPEISRIKADLEQIETDHTTLENEGEVGGLSAQEYREVFDALEQRREQLIRRARELDKEVARLAAMEEDPEGYLEDFYSRYPAVKPNFPW